MFTLEWIKNIYSSRSNILFKVDIAAYVCYVSGLIFTGKLYVIEAVWKIAHIHCFTNNAVSAVSLV